MSVPDNAEGQIALILGQVTRNASREVIEAAARSIVDLAKDALEEDQRRHLRQKMRTREMAQLKSASLGLSQVMEAIKELSKHGLLTRNPALSEAQDILEQLKREVDLDLKVDRSIIKLEVYDPALPIVGPQSTIQIYCPPRLAAALGAEAAELSGTVSFTFASYATQPRGRPRKEAVHLVADEIAHHFEALSGKLVARSRNNDGGQVYGFEKLLGEIFGALAIRANAERHTKRLIADRKMTQDQNQK